MSGIITRQHTDEDYITWFYDKNNKVIGYVEEGRLFAMRNGYAEHFDAMYWSEAEARKLIEMRYIPEPRKIEGGMLPQNHLSPEDTARGEKLLPRQDDNTVALIGYLAVRLARWEPDDKLVKQALEWLKNVRS